ncbi:hypothetical protein D6783_05645, partial [Candidatus Woesearchaeota archaeon]
IYPALKKLRRGKLITYRRFGRKKIYHLTPEGETALRDLYMAFRKYFAGVRAQKSISSAKSPAKEPKSPGKRNAETGRVRKASRLQKNTSAKKTERRSPKKKKLKN